ncbi:hypothetical protein KAI04_03035 [Candidatus Pacearchaeota archaeon]|nr:hypothetical protein [Candidatus Pacearchaeota archaeon]
MTSNPITDFGEGIGKGLAKGLLEYSESKIKSLVNLFRENKLKFIGDRKTIEVAKETKKSGEWAFYKTYVSDSELLFNIRLGLLLRKVESDTDRLDNLKSKIRKKYGIKGLHIAYFVQNGVLNRYVAILLDNLDSTEKLKRKISDVLTNIEKHTIFVDSRYSERQLIKDSMTIAAHNPEIFIVSGIYSAAKIVRESKASIKELLKKYKLEEMITGMKEILFFKLII